MVLMRVPDCFESHCIDRTNNRDFHTKGFCLLVIPPVPEMTSYLNLFDTYIWYMSVKDVFA